MERAEAERARAATFRAAPAPRFPQPQPPQPSRQPLTEAHTPNLSLRSRSIARAAFDAAVAANQHKEEVSAHFIG